MVIWVAGAECCEACLEMEGYIFENPDDCGVAPGNMHPSCMCVWAEVTDKDLDGIDLQPIRDEIPTWAEEVSSRNILDLPLDPAYISTFDLYRWL